MTDTLPPFIGHLDHHATHQPDAVAIHFHGAEVTWAELAARVRRNAAGQRAAGVGIGGRVAYLGKNNPRCLESVFAAGLAGTVCAVVNWRLSPEEIAYALKDAEAELLFVAQEFLPAVEEVRADLPKLRQLVVVGPDGDYESWLGSHAPITDDHDAQHDDGWFQLYTSGTTGFPKGAVLTHGGVRAHSEAISVDLGLRPESISMVAMPLYHVGGVCWAMAGTWLGAKTVMIQDVDPAGLLTDITAHRVTHSFFVPAIFAFFQKVPDLRERDLSSLECLVYGASPMPLPLLEASLAVFGCGFWQVYGMTEQSGVVTMLEPESHRDPNVRHRLLSAGKAITGCEVRVVQPETGEDAPVGAMGEVWVRSKQRLREYYNRPEATAKAFAGDWYRSGDIGKLDEDGYLYISDRLKDMIITGGENVYPAEVERVLVQHPAVAEVAVIGVPNDEFVEEVKAVVAFTADAEIEDGDLIHYAREHLAHYKCPRTIDRVDALPRNATGKVLKKDLRAPYWEGRERTLA